MLPKIPTNVAGAFADGQQMFSGAAAALGESQLWQRSPPIVTTTILATTALTSFLGNDRLLAALNRAFFFAFAALPPLPSAPLSFFFTCINLRG